MFPLISLIGIIVQHKGEHPKGYHDLLCISEGVVS